MSDDHSQISNPLSMIILPRIKSTHNFDHSHYNDIDYNKKSEEAKPLFDQ